MKQFKTASNDMPSTAMHKEPTTGTPIGGLPKENGMLITQPQKHHRPKTASLQKSPTTKLKKNATDATIQHKKIIQTQEEAESLHRLLKSKQSRKEYDVFRKARLIYTQCTDEEQATIAKASQPCGEDAAFALFMRYLRIHKQTKDEDQASLKQMRKDFVECIAGFPEYAVTLALIELVTGSENVWFPALATLLQLMEKHTVYEPKIMDWERGFSSKEDIEKMWDEREGRDMDAWCANIIAKSKKESQEQRKLRGLI